MHELIENNSYTVPEKVVIGETEYITDVIETSIPQPLNRCLNFNPQSFFQKLPPEIWDHRKNISPLKGGVTMNSFVGCCGTLGLICIDSQTKGFVGLTNAHVVDYPTSMLWTGNWNLQPPFNWHENTSWRNRYEITQSTENLSGINNFPPWPPYTLNSIGYVKKISPFLTGIKTGRFTDSFGVSYIGIDITGSQTNQIDAAVISLNKCGGLRFGDTFQTGLEPFNTKYQVISLEESFKQMNLDYNNPMPFATTAEINSLVDIPRDIYSVGRSTGAKGKPGCRLRVSSLYVSTPVNFQPTAFFTDLIDIQSVDQPAWIVYGGDSGSIVIADFDGIFKIIGLLFAGGSNNPNNQSFVACRIDRIAEKLGIEAWSDQTKTFEKNNDIKIFIEDYNTLTGNFNVMSQENLPIKKTIPGSGDFWFMGLANISDLTGIGIPGTRTYTLQDMNSNPVSQSSLIQADLESGIDTIIFK
jgi:hypothetical protein